MGRADFSDVLGEFQEFGPRRSIPVDVRWRERFPGASAEELQAWATRCKLIEAAAWDLAEGVIAGRLRENAAKAELGHKFPELDPDRIGKTIAQALYFASK